MEKRELNVEARNVGKGETHKLRAEAKIPAVFYGPYVEKAVPLAVTSTELSKALAGGSNPLLTLRAKGLAGIDGKMAMVRDEQFHPVTMKRVHVDFIEVRMDEEIKVEVRIILTGKAAGVAEGGILQQSLRELEVFCLPAAVPEKIEVDVSSLTIGDSLHISDITLPKGVRPVSAINYTLAAVVPPEKEEVAPVVAAEGVEPALVGAEGAVEGAAPAEGAAPGAAPAKGAAPGAAPAKAAPGAAPAKGAAPGAAPAKGAAPAAKAEPARVEKKKKE
ncbi:MAG: 50S ribosomal protein L25 [Pseudomonadota bacterium]